MKASPKIIALSAALVVIAVAFFCVDIFQIKVFGLSKTFSINDVCKSELFEEDVDGAPGNGFSKFARIAGIVAAVVTGITVLEALTESDETKAGSALCIGASAQVISYVILVIDAFKLKSDWKDALDADPEAKAWGSIIECNVLYAPMIFLAGALIIAVITKKDLKTT